MKKLLISICLTVISIFSYAQKPAESYIESIDVHTNTNFLITGETVYYSIYCLDVQKNKPSALSKLAYVELIGENQRPLLQTKISLQEGRGAGDFFLPSTVPSGNYTLIAYTKWMRNFPLDNFFQKQITIINPYLKPFNSETIRTIDKTSVRESTGKHEESRIHLAADKIKYSHRQKVVVVIKNNDTLNDCRLSLNVHRYHKNLESLSGVYKVMSHDLPPLKKEFVTFLPDLRGEIISGMVRESVSHLPVSNKNVYLSASGTSFFFQISRTDSTGRFYFHAKNIQTQTGIKFQLDQSPDFPSVELILDDEFVNDYQKFKPLPFSMDTLFRKEVEQRNVYSQIENAYFLKKQDSILASNQKPFFGQPDKVYNLDDFTRFPTMEDIFREYMYEVVVSKRDKKFVIRLVNGRNGRRFLNTPLLLVDGNPVFDTEILMNYNPLLVKKVSLLTREYVYGGILFDGILSINTYSADAKELPISPISKEYTSWQRPKKYYSPVYDVNASLERIPDFRIQLYWNPIITIEPGQEFIAEFYTSDVEGDFLIEASGFNSIGEKVNVRQVIQVQK